MRRSLVLTREGARHPFRASLPSRVALRRGKVDPTAEVRRPVSDARGFVNAYVAAFAAVLAFIM